MDDDLLRGHLQNHWLAATAGTALFGRVSRTLEPSDAAREVAELAIEIRQDRSSLRTIMADVGVEPSALTTAAAKTGARLARLKPRGRMIGRSALTDVLDLEALRAAVTGKRAGWEMLRAFADTEEHLDTALLDELLQRADHQLERLRRLHLEVAALHLRR